MKNLIKALVLVLLLAGTADTAMAQKKKVTPRKSVKRTTKQTTTANVATTENAAAAPAPNTDTLPIKQIKKSLRPDEAVDATALNDRVPLPYEHLRADDAVYRHKIWREIDGREKMNQPFMYSADDNTGNQRFISILLSAIQNDSITVFDATDDRFTTPMTMTQVAQAVAGEVIDVPIYGENGEIVRVDRQRNEVSLDSFYRFRIKEEVIFDKESSRLFWRILGIAPLKKIVTTEGLDLGFTELFWVYYPDMRPVFAKSNVYNGKNYGARMSWEELFEGRMFSGRIVKSTIENPGDKFIKEYGGMTDKPILQLLEGERVKEKIFNYEQDLWSY
jgi:gliding motility associated protien GldN